MRAALLALPLLFFCASAPAGECAPSRSQDWMATGNPLDAAVRPADCASVEQTPPDFSWPDLSRGAAYTLHLTFPSGETRSLPARENWLNWPQALPPGEYAWKVIATDARGTRTSAVRRFKVSAAAQPFVVPDLDALLARVKAKPHPRGLPEEATLRAMARSRAKGLDELRAEVDGKMRAPLPAAPDRASVGSNNAAAFDEAKRTLNALAAAVLTAEPRYRDEALRRVKNLASWDPEGATAFHVRGMDMSARMITWALTLGYDWLFPFMDSEEKEKLRGTLRVRLRHIHDDVIGERSRVARYPRDSHGQLSVGMLGIMATLVAGDLPEADAYVRRALPLGMNLTMPWGGEDGGFANGTPYAIWDVGESLPYWSVLRWATGIDLAQKAWVRNFPRFLAYFNPPGTPARLFGDGHAQAQLEEQQARFGKALAAFAPTPFALWYASRLSGEDAKRFEYLMAPPLDLPKKAPLPKDAPQALHVPSIGWVAMHSSLDDPGRVSVYFKSSPPPFGAFNHQHADQNAFVLNAGGARLAIESGYYDRYKSPHWWKWLKTTQAKNAITYDGGQGQLFFEADDGRMGYGAITRFVDAERYALATGDATPAYGGALEKAVRSIAHVRPNLVLVYDVLASATPRSWEWNLHALERMEARSARAVRIASGGQSLCVEMLAGPAVRFTQSDEWTAAPREGRSQWHGRFASAPLGRAEFLFLLSVGCAAPRAELQGREVRLAGAAFRLSDEGLVPLP